MVVPTLVGGGRPQPPLSHFLPPLTSPKNTNMLQQMFFYCILAKSLALGKPSLRQYYIRVVPIISYHDREITCTCTSGVCTCTYTCTICKCACVCSDPRICLLLMLSLDCWEMLTCFIQYCVDVYVYMYAKCT